MGIKRSRQRVLPNQGAQTDSRLTDKQNIFARVLAANTGLDINVIAAWLLAEESDSAARTRDSENNNDWLNIGYTDTATFGARDSVWNDPTKAAMATAGWLRGQNTIPGYGRASSGIQNILKSVGKSPQDQIRALQTSGWASSGYGDLPSLYKSALSQPASNRGNGGNSGNSNSGGGGGSGSPSLLDVLGALVSGNIDTFAADIALVWVELAKNVGIGLWDLVYAPLWHWNQRAVAYYNTTILDPKQYGAPGDYQWAFAWTAAFWGFGYTLLFTEPGGGLKPVPVKRSRLGRHVRRAQALPARKSLVKPRDVQENTPTKPEPIVSSTSLTHVGSLTTTRARPIRVEGDTHGSRGETPTPSAPIDRENTTAASSSRTKPHEEHHARAGTHQGRGSNPQEGSEGGR